MSQLEVFVAVRLQLQNRAHLISPGYDIYSAVYVWMSKPFCGYIEAHPSDCDEYWEMLSVFLFVFFWRRVLFPALIGWPALHTKKIFDLIQYRNYHSKFKTVKMHVNAKSKPERHFIGANYLCRKKKDGLSEWFLEIKSNKSICSAEIPFEKLLSSLKQRRYMIWYSQLYYLVTIWRPKH